MIHNMTAHEAEALLASGTLDDDARAYIPMRCAPRAKA